MLPLIGALAGSALAPSLGLSALTAGAIGSGLGAYAQTGDLEKGILAGLGSYGMGMLGSKLMGAGEAAAGAGTAGSTDLQSAVAAGDQAAIQAAQAGNTGATVGFFDKPMPSIPTGPGRAGLPQLGSSAPSTIGETAIAGLGAGVTGESLAYEPEKPKKKEYKDIPEAEAATYNQRLPGQGYRAGYDPEFDYFAKQGGIMKLQEGGELATRNDKEVLDMAVMAIKGQIGQPEIILGEFLNRFGEEALRSLVRSVRSGEIDAAAGKAEGKIDGAGDGMEDLVPASLEGEQDVMLSEGEFVVPADVVSGIGNGSTDAGSERLYEMLDRVRQARTGKQEQAPQINSMEMMPA